MFPDYLFVSYDYAVTKKVSPESFAFYCCMFSENKTLHINLQTKPCLKYNLKITTALNRKLKKNPSEILVEQRVKSNEQRVKSNEQRAKSFISFTSISSQMFFKRSVPQNFTKTFDINILNVFDQASLLLNFFKVT